jgi:chromosome segregation ATPase
VTCFLSQELADVSTAKSLFIRHESDVWESLRSQWAALTEANERLVQRSAEVADLRLLCDELKSEAAAAQTEAASAWTEASSAREQVASLAEEMRQRQLELGQATSERDEFRSQSVEAVSRAEALGGQLVEATERLAEATAQAETLAKGLAVAIGSAQSAQAMASQRRAQAEGLLCLLCDFVFVFILHLVSEEYCPAVLRIRDLS